MTTKVEAEQARGCADEIEKERVVDLVEVQVLQAQQLEGFEILEGLAEVRQGQVRDELQVEGLQPTLARHIEESLCEVFVPDVRQRQTFQLFEVFRKLDGGERAWVILVVSEVHFEVL